MNPTRKQEILDKTLTKGDFALALDEIHNRLVEEHQKSPSPKLADEIFQIIQIIDMAAPVSGIAVPQEIYQHLLSLGFTVEEAGELADYDEVLQFADSQLSRSINRDEFLSYLQQYRPFLYQRVRQLEISPDQTSYLIRHLKNIGISDDFINSVLLYPSGRPISTMIIITTIPILDGDLNEIRLFVSSDKVLLNSDWLNKSIEIHQKSLFPVIRYGAGMSRGAYTPAAPFETSINDYCGTFYYYEPGSNIFLLAKDILIVPNKLMASVYLLEKRTTLSLIYRHLDSFGKFLPSKPDQGGYSGLDNQLIFDVSGKKYPAWDYFLDAMISGRHDFLNHYPSLYALEDRFDQPICQEARRKNFELIIFTTMTGMNRVVTEIIDIRPRAISYANLYQIPLRNVVEHTPLQILQEVV